MLADYQTAFTDTLRHSKFLVKWYLNKYKNTPKKTHEKRPFTV